MTGINIGISCDNNSSVVISNTSIVDIDTEFIKTIRLNLGNRGFNIVEPFNVTDYNKHCKFKINDYGDENTMGLIIGCNKDMWSSFHTFIRAHYIEHREIPKDPMNLFCKTTIEQVLNDKSINQEEYDVRYDWNTVSSGRYVHLQTAGHFANVAHYDREVMWSAHPVYGLWFVFRALVVFPSKRYPQTLSTPPPLLDKETKEEMVKWTNEAIDQGWSCLETRLKIRDACKVGKEMYRYEGDMFDYFYPIKRTTIQVLNSIIQDLIPTIEDAQQHQEKDKETANQPSVCCSGPSVCNTSKN